MGLTAQQILDETLRWAIDSGDEAGARAQLAKGANPEGTYGMRTFLCHAVNYARLANDWRDRRGVMQALLGAGADIDRVGGDGKSALMLALGGNNRELVAWLLDAGADVNAKTGADGYTPLHEAVMHDLSILADWRVPMLLARGADPDIGWGDRGLSLRQMLQGIQKSPAPDIKAWAENLLAKIPPSQAMLSEAMRQTMAAKGDGKRFKLKGAAP